MEMWELEQRQSLPLEQKIIWSKDRIKDFCSSMRYDVSFRFRTQSKPDVILLKLMIEMKIMEDVSINAVTEECGLIEAIYADDGSSIHLQDYLRGGCNDFTKGQERSWPLGIWTKKDIDEYIRLNNL